MNLSTDHKWLQNVIPQLEVKARAKVERELRELEDQRIRLRGSLMIVLGNAAADEIINSTELASDPERYRLGEYEFGGSKTFCQTGFYLYLRLPDFLDNDEYGNESRLLASSWIDSETDLISEVDRIQSRLEGVLNKFRSEQDRRAADALREKAQREVPSKTGVPIEHKFFLQNMLRRIEKGEKLAPRYSAAMSMIALVMDFVAISIEAAEAVYAGQSEDDDYDDQDDDDEDE